VLLPELERYRPEALAGSVAALRQLAAASQRARASWPFLIFGVLVLTATGRPVLSADDRELFWKAFQVPVWEQCRRWDGALYAEECAARNGLHLRVPHPPAYLRGATVLHEPCACGDTSPRIVSEVAAPGPGAAMAASASWARGGVRG
jgi:hypothetical protein